MKRLLLLTVAIFVLGKATSQRVQQDTIISTFNMGIYDVDDDCYKDSTYYCYKILSGGRLIYYSVRMMEHNPQKKPALLFVDSNDRPMKQLRTLISTLEYLRDKYAEWSITAKENKVTDYKKEFGECDLKKQTFYLSYFNKEKNTSYISQTKFFFTPIFQVNDVGTCFLRLEQEDRKRLIGELANAAPFLYAQQRGDRATMKEYLRNRKNCDYFKVLGHLQFSSKEQVQSLIDALKEGLKSK